jgi:hypothetical protein
MLANGFLAKVGPELVLTEAEIVQLASAYAGWRQYYGASPIDPRWVAALTLCGTAYGIIMPKFGRMQTRKKAEKNAAAVAKASQAGGSFARPMGPNGTGPTVVPMPGL